MKGEDRGEPRPRGVACGVGQRAGSDGAGSVCTPRSSEICSRFVLAAAVPAPPVQQMFQPGQSLPGPCARSGMSTSVKGCSLGSKAVASYTAQETSEHTRFTHFSAPCRLKGDRDGLSLTLRMIPPEEKSCITHYAFKSSINHTPCQGDSGQYNLRKAVVSVHGKVCPCMETVDTQTA